MQTTMILDNEAATLSVGALLARHLQGGTCIFLEGTLGAGKTTFCRGILHQLGHSAAVKSPTYTLVEPYRLARWDVYHFDLYRLASPDELDYIGIRDYFHAQSVCLIEWPQRGEGYLETPDIRCIFEVVGEARNVSFIAETKHGEILLHAMLEAQSLETQPLETQIAKPSS